MASLAERFWLKVVKTEGCWVWTGARHRDGYGLLCIRDDSGKKRQIMAHRVSYELHKGPIGDGRRVLHSCDNPPCVRPKHLFQGTQLENIADRHLKGRSRGAAGIRNRHAKLSEADVHKIRNLCAAGQTQMAVGMIYGLTQASISAIVLRKTWKGVA